MGKSRKLPAAAAALAAALALTGCIAFPGGDRPAPTAPEGAPPTTDAPGGDGAPSQADPSIVVLTDDQVVPFPQYERSTPEGSWEIGTGIPVGFPAGVPVFPDRWIKNAQQEFESQGRYGYSSMFWGGYDDMEALALRLDELGFELAREQDEGKLVIVADSDRYRVVLTGTETAQNPGDDHYLDASYTIGITFQD
jgi:hypothetical protein